MWRFHAQTDELVRLVRGRCDRRAAAHPRRLRLRPAVLREPALELGARGRGADGRRLLLRVGDAADLRHRARAGERRAGPAQRGGRALRGHAALPGRRARATRLRHGRAPPQPARGRRLGGHDPRPIAMADAARGVDRPHPRRRGCRRRSGPRPSTPTRASSRTWPARSPAGSRRGSAAPTRSARRARSRRSITPRTPAPRSVSDLAGGASRSLREPTCALRLIFMPIRRTDAGKLRHPAVRTLTNAPARAAPRCGGVVRGGYGAGEGVVGLSRPAGSGAAAVIRMSAGMLTSRTDSAAR